MTSLLPDEEDFERRWEALESPTRRYVAKLANHGTTSADPQVAALVGGLARRRLRPHEPWLAIGVVALGYVAVTDVFFGGPDSLVLVALIAGLSVLYSVRKRNHEEALAASEAALATFERHKQEQQEQARLDEEREPQGD